MKIFAVSDLHSFYTETIQALSNAGFDKTDSNHLLVVCGDAFDRGEQSKEMLEFLNSVDNKVLVKGNHDDLLIDLIDRQFPYRHDYHNGTTDTIYQLGDDGKAKNFADFCKNTDKVYRPLYNQMVDYFETKNHIFVHSWIPVISTNGSFLSFMEDWRSANSKMWQDARWGNPFELAELEILKPDKTVVFGHWHTSWARAHLENKPEFEADADFSIYYGDGYIGIDACTAHSGKANVLVIDDELL